MASWEPSQPNQGPHDFIQMLVGLMESLFNTMNLLIPDFVQPALFLTYTFINDAIWKIMVEQVTCFNILGIVNLKQDVDALIDFCRRNYNYWQSRSS